MIAPISDVPDEVFAEVMREILQSLTLEWELEQAHKIAGIKAPLYDGHTYSMTQRALLLEVLKPYLTGDGILPGRRR